MRRPPYRWLLILVATLSVACGSDSTGPGGPHVASVTVTPGAFTLYLGGGRTLTAVAADATDSAIASATITWSSRDTLIARVSSVGLVSAVGVGIDTIIAQSGTATGKSVLTVSAVPVDSVSLAAVPSTLYVNQSRQLTAMARDSAGHPLTGRTISWISSDTATASVSASGLVIGKQVGSLTITATAEGKQALANMNITLVPVTLVTIVPAGDTAIVGDTITPVAYARDSAGTPIPGSYTVAWGVSDSSVLQPISGGRFLALANGLVTVTASMGGVSHGGPIDVTTCADTLQQTAGSFSFPIVSGGLASDGGGTIELGLFKLASAWYGGGVMYGTDSAHMVVSYEPSLNLGTGVAAQGLCQLASFPYIRTRTKVVPLPGLGAPAGLRVVQEAFHSASTSADSAFVLFRYTFTDTSAVGISGLRAGFIVDWDLGNSAGTNLLEWSPGNIAQLALEGDSVTYTERLGMVVFSGTGATSMTGWLNAADPSTRGAYYGKLGAANQMATVGPGDIRALAGVPLIGIPAYGRVIVYFAIIGGATPAKFSTSRAAAKALADALGYN